jgi:hypothetical protein
VSEELKFVVSAGAVLTVLAGFLLAIASKTEELMRDDVKEEFASWLNSAQLDKPLRDWCCAFTYMYDYTFGIDSRGGQYSAPRAVPTSIFALGCVIIVFVAFGQALPALVAIDNVMHHNDFSQQFPEFARSIIVDLILMLSFVLVLSIIGIYLSVLKTRIILENLSDGAMTFKVIIYVMLDVMLSLFIFMIVFQVAQVLQELSTQFVARNIFTQFKDMPYSPPEDASLAPLIAEVYFRVLLPVSLAVLVPIGWTVMFAVRGFAAKALMHVGTLHRFAVANCGLEKHPLLVTSWCLIAILFVVFWSPVGAYTLFYYFKVQ